VFSHAPTSRILSYTCSPPRPAGGLHAGPSPDPVSAVTTLQYKVGIVNLSTIDLSGLGAGEQKNTAGFTGFFTMTLKDTTGGKALTMVLDSMAIDSATQGRDILQTAADSSKGSTWRGLLTDKGRIDNLVLVQGGPGAQQFEAVWPASSRAARRTPRRRARCGPTRCPTPPPPRPGPPASS
jgi:hypothetical protein